MFAVLHLFQNFGVIVLQNFLLSVTFLRSMFLKYCFLLLRKRLTQVLRCSLQFSKLMIILSKLHLLFNLDLVIMAFRKVLFMKGVLLYLRYFCFNPFMYNVEKWSNIIHESVKFLSAKFLKVVLKLFGVCSKGLLSKFLNSDKKIFFGQTSFCKQTFSVYGNQIFPSLQCKIS